MLTLDDLRAVGKLLESEGTTLGTSPGWGVGRQSRWKLGKKDRRYAHVSSDCPNLTEYSYKTLK